MLSTKTIPKLLDPKSSEELKLWAEKLSAWATEINQLTITASAEAPAAMTIKSIQRGTVTIANDATTGTATITAVDTAKTELRMLGFSSTHTGAVANTMFPRIALTNSTTITATRNTSTTTSITVSFEVTEYE